MQFEARSVAKTRGAKSILQGKAAAGATPATAAHFIAGATVQAALVMRIL